MPRRESALTRGFEPLVALLWPLFLVWTAIVAVLWTTGLSEETAKAIVKNTDLGAAAVVFLRSTDTVWLLLAAANLYLGLADRVGLGTARLWAAIVLAAGAVIAVASVRTGWPLGPIYFTTRLGLKLGPVPLGWPLWWLVVVIGGRMLAERLLPRATHGQLALVTGGLALLAQANLEPLAWKVRAFWLWDVPGTFSGSLPPWRNFATWWLVATALASLLRERRVVTTGRPPAWAPALILVLCNAVFLLAHLTIALRG